ncbi:pentapeptide repeat-containing protein [Frisingicoccus sp.]|uniref:pentapeptide repeat-containing protein n=1 Tax=Frisingicoccus sp. TaxID=1918627 RepID=UPI00399ADB59
MEFPAVSILKQDIDFQDIKKLTFSNCSAIHAVIRNSLITECTFDNVNMSHCDLLSTKIFSSIFNKVNFDSADIFSMLFSNCKFINTDFTGAGIEDITFSNCIFIDCAFNGIGLKNCTFRHCKFDKIHPDSCTFSLNNYEECAFFDCFFKGSFYYQIFKQCKFDNVLMDSNILKYNYGLGNVPGITYFYKTDNIQDMDVLKDNLLTECLVQKLFINAVIVDYNFSDAINPELAIKSIKAIGRMVEYEILLRTDEMIFLKNLYHHFYINGLIAPIVLYRLFEDLKKIYVEESPDNIVIIKSKEAMYMISNSLYFDFSDFCEKLRISLEEKIKYIVPVQIKIHYKNEPLVPLDFLLNQYFPGTFRRTLTESGSFLEYIEAGQNGLEILKIFIQLLGITVPIIYSEIKEKRKKKAPKTTSIQKNVEVNIQSIHDQQNVAELIQNTCQLINSSDILTHNQKGYSNDNIQEIKVEYHINIQV